MNKRYSEELAIASAPVATDTPIESNPEDLIIEIISDVVKGKDFLKGYYRCTQMVAPAVLGMAQLIANSMFAPIWESLGRPANGESVVFHDSTHLPQWYIRFETTDKGSAVYSRELESDFLQRLLVVINSELQTRNRQIYVGQLTAPQFKYFIDEVNGLLRQV